MTEQLNSADAVGQPKRVVLRQVSPASAGPYSAGDVVHRTRVRQERANPPLATGGDEAQTPDVAHSRFGPSSPELADTVESIKAAHRKRCFWMEQRKRSDLALGSYLRTALGWSLAKPSAERETIRKLASELIGLGEKYVKVRRKAFVKGLPIPLPSPELNEHAGIVVNAIEMRGKIDELEAVETATMEQLAKTLPAYEWAGSVRGFGALGLAIIAAEAGRDLRDFATKGKLYKRLGLAVIDGKRQGGLSKSAPKAEWIEHGYSPQRRSRIWTIGISVLMSGNERYRKIYLDRKAYEVAKAEAEGLRVVPAAKIPEKRKAEFRSLGHVDNRARRYMEKHLICDLWRAWRRLTI